MENNKECIDICNELLRGEISAVETYDQAIEKFRGEPGVEELLGIRHDHQNNVDTLHRNIVSMGGEPSKDSGAWGVFAKTVAGSSKLFGEKAALWALEQGERHGKEKYEEAADDRSMLAECRDLVRNDLLPRQKQHLEVLSHLQQASA